MNRELLTTYSTPIAILIGFALVAGAILFTNTAPKTANAVSATRDDNRVIYGNKKAAVTIVEFSDYQCPFCARLHPTLQRVVDESGGAINWEYRHVPLQSHGSAEVAAVAAECLLRTEGNDAFWSFSDALFQNQRLINHAYVKTTALVNGLSEANYEDCLTDASIKQQIQEDVAAARYYGGRGTPFSLIVHKDGTVEPMSGALPYEAWQQALNL